MVWQRLSTYLHEQDGGVELRRVKEEIDDVLGLDELVHRVHRLLFEACELYGLAEIEGVAI